MRLFKIRGGVHPHDQKHLAAEQPIEHLPLPALLHIPLQQHIGAPATPVVRRGQIVAKGELLAQSQGIISAPVHASTSGRIMGIGSYPAHHASGLSVRTITLQPDGEERWDETIGGVADPFALPPEAIAERVAAAGIVGMGGATFPAAVKLNLRNRYPLHTLVINGAECEPYLTCDDRLMREQAQGVVDGVRIMAHALGVTRIIIAIENNKPAAQTQMSQAAAADPNIRIARLPTRYPMGSERHLVQALTGRETPARGLTADIGVVVHNAATAFAVHEALRQGRPLISRVVTVSGAAVARPRNLRVPLGARVRDLLDHCGGFSSEPAQLISGGPMMGQPLPSTRVPMVKGSNGVLALTTAEVARRDPMPCIRCASCVQACPCGLLPLEMAAHTRAGDLEGAVRLGLMDCIGCGSCAYVCPAHLPLVQLFNYAKGEMAARGRAKQKHVETKRLAAQRLARMEAIKQAKRAAMAKRKRTSETPATAASAPAPTTPATPAERATSGAGDPPPAAQDPRRAAGQVEV
ncbi:electron transport complex subunit RsxC [Thiocapsa imhoffii]|uniref:Ion-translocating oxidoreductase complex subunit C n=1 Tax=Thiocapsa imhoffii TaxID=382777 RepID=A0A9X1B7R5_9GAMM|nr:electron transport complex subunit RsxC [Thiocapsa imhoffii]MBK1643191.1 electron transport complex subunit RsxC [Thiocapsa imhoffii]